MDVLLVRNGIVENRIVSASLEEAQAQLPFYICVETIGGADIGWTFADGVFAAPVVVEAPPIVEPVPTPAVKEPITRLAFMRRFPTEKRIAIRESAKTNPILNDAMSLLDLAQDVDLSDPDTVNLVGYCVQLGLIAVEDAAVILG